MSRDDAAETRAAGAEDVTRAATAVDQSPQIPQSIASFRVVRLIGAGGMGAVYEAEQTMPRRTVALKVIRPGLVTPDMRRRFENEVQALGRLQHPGIAQIYQAGVTDLGGGPQPYFAMELVSGLPLSEYAHRHDLGTRERLRLVAVIGDAVQHAHQRGIIHRDLKPGNILVDLVSGQPKILDFGIARTTDPDQQMTSHTLFGQLVGTLPYMSPEQLAADPAGVDTRSDVYALGVILYELLTGKLPHDLTHRSTLDALTAIRDLDPARVGSLDRRLRGDVETIVAKALEKEKDRRYGSAAELAADIRRYLDDQPIVARPPSATYQLRKFARRNKVLVGGVAAAFVILLGGVVASTWQAVRARRAERLAGARLVEADQARAVAQNREVEATDARRTADERRAEAETNFHLAEEARARAEQQRETNRQLLYASDLNLAQRMWEEGNYPRLIELLDRHRPTPDRADLRGFEWFHLWHAAHLHERSFELPNITGGMTMTADGSLIAAGDAAGNIRIWEVATGKPRLSLTGPGVSAIAISSDRRLLAVGTRTGIVRVVDMATAADRATFSMGPKPIPVSAVVFAAANSAVVGSGSRITTAWDIDSSRELFTHVGAVVVVPSAQELKAVIARGPTDVRLWSTSGEQPVTLPDPVRDVVASGDGRRIIALSTRGLIFVLDDQGRIVRSFQPSLAVAPPIHASSTGRLVAGHTPTGIVVVDTDSARTLAALPIRATPPVTFSPSERLVLVSGISGLTVFDIIRSETKAIIRGHAGSTLRVAVSSDERRLVTAAADGIKVWDLSNATAVRLLDQPPSQIISVGAAPRGTSLAAMNRVGSADGRDQSKVVLWDAATGREITSRLFNLALNAVAISGPILVAGDNAGGLTFWRHERDEEPMTIAAHDQPVRAVARSRDGTRVASVGINDIKVWDPAARRETVRLSQPNARSAAFSPDASQLVTAGFERVARIWTLGRRSSPRVLRGMEQGIRIVDWSPDGKRIAAGDDAGGVVVWDVASGEILARLRAHPNLVRALRFSPDGWRLLTGGLEGALKLWDVHTWNEVARFSDQTTVINDAAFALDGQAIAVGSNRYGVLIWRTGAR